MESCHCTHESGLKCLLRECLFCLCDCHGDIFHYEEPAFLGKFYVINNPMW